ncbi:MAG: HypC/HybG/HupF family hydrogenase formation chaperone [Gemmatimonadetes bacterium]|nr:HypC/HybG/HupF family hydrogenase formation chaperone [Gemmatimonadota bacterium]
MTGRCATCADEGIEGRVLALIGGSLAEVEMEGQVREVAMDLLDQVAIGDLVLVHAGVAIAHLGR